MSFFLQKVIVSNPLSSIWKYKSWVILFSFPLERSEDLKINHYVALNKNKCGECFKEFYDFERRPLDYCPHCNEELTILNSEKIDEKVIKVRIDAITGEVKIHHK